MNVFALNLVYILSAALIKAMALFPVLHRSYCCLQYE